MTKTKAGNVRTIATFNPLPWQVPAWRDTSAVVVYTGSAGGGKSRLAAEKLHGYCLRYAGAMAMVLRKERVTLTNSILPLLEREVIGDDPRIRHAQSKHRYEYANGSMLIYGGMADDEQRENVRSMALDIVWMEEATRFTEQDYNELLARMRGNAANWRQIVLTTNPDAPTHWIKRRLIDGLEAHVYTSAAGDNPHNPEQYALALGAMTGIQRQRLLEGKWTQAEGVIYDNWTHENITLAADFNPDYGAVYWGVDDGYVYGGGPGTLSYHPRVILMAQITPVGGLNVFAEYYRTLELPEASISAAMGYGYPAPELAYVDSSAAELRARFSTLGIMNAGATHPVGEGIKNLRRFICDGNGQRLLKVHPRCENLIRELQTYRYSDSTAGVVAGEPKPEKLDDHGCLVAGTMIATGRGQVAIEDVRAGDRVMTSEGYFPVIAAGMTSASADLWEVGFSDGRTLRGTGNHPIYVQGAGYTDLNALRYGDIIRTDFRCSEVLPWQKQILRFGKRKLSSTGLYSGAIQTPNEWKIGATSNRTPGTSSAASRRFTVKSGKRTMARSLMGITFITGTGIPGITVSKILSVFRRVATCLITEINRIAWKLRGRTLNLLGMLLQRGIEVKRAAHGIVSMAGKHGSLASPSSTFAISADGNTKVSLGIPALAFAPTTANQHGGVRQVPMMCNAPANTAEPSSLLIVTTRRGFAPVRAQQNTVTVVNARRLNKRGPVFNITVDAVHEYYANGVLVHNCDSARYLCWGLRHIEANV